MEAVDQRGTSRAYFSKDGTLYWDVLILIHGRCGKLRIHILTCTAATAYQRTEEVNKI